MVTTGCFTRSLVPFSLTTTMASGERSKESANIFIVTEGNAVNLPSLTMLVGPRFLSDPTGRPPIMNFNDQHRICHAERSEASLGPSRETLRGVYPRAKRRLQGAITFPIFFFKFLNRRTTNPRRRLRF